MKTLARWESRSGKHCVTLTEAENMPANVTMLWGYTSPFAGGGLCATTLAEAFVELEKRIAEGYFLPDAAKTPMHRVY